MEQSVGDVNDGLSVSVEQVKRKHRKKSVGNTRWRPEPGMKRLSGYQHFLNQCLEGLKVRYPNHSIVLSSVSKMCAENWQNLSNDLKKVFQDEAERINVSMGRKPPTKTTTQLPNAPKPPQSPYYLYYKDNRYIVKENHPEMKMSQVSALITMNWKNADSETRMKYIKLAAKQRYQYHQEVSKLENAEKEADVAVKTSVK